MPEKKKHDFISVTDLKIREVNIYIFHRLETKKLVIQTISHIKNVSNICIESMHEHFTVHWYPETWGKKTENQLIFLIKTLVL